MEINKLLPIAVLATLALSSCEHGVYTETTVHPDGSLDKVVAFESKDSTHNLFGLSEQRGWQKKVRLKEGESDSVKDPKFITTFQRTYASVDEANADLTTSSDTLFHVTSNFEKEFRWFYTYLRYSETFHSLNRLALASDDYLVPEDFAFIDRLPAEGKKISKGDEYYLGELHNRIFDVYGLRAYFEEYFSLCLKLLSDQDVDQRWADTLRVHKENIFEVLKNKKDIEDDFLLHAMDSLGIPVNQPEVTARYRMLAKVLDSKVAFISSASDGKYHNRINLPWTIVETNADSVAGNSLFWSPPSIKFLLKDYTMYGESRQLNGWAVAATVALMGFSGYLFARRRKSQK